MLPKKNIAYDRYKVLEKISHGAFSVIYKVFDQQEQNEKCLKVEIIEENYISMILHEFKVSQMFDSPCLCKSYEFLQNAITMELLSDNLSSIRRKRMNPPSIPLLLNITMQCLRAISIMHNINVIHCDIKPSNFVIRKKENDYDIVLLDFGLSQYHDEDPKITEFRFKLDRNPRYSTLHTIDTNEWNKEDDIGAFIYSISDFWKNELPWDGRTTKNTVLEIKRNYNLSLLLPTELHFLIQYIDQSAEFLYKKAEEELQKYNRNIDEEFHYLFDPQDKNWKPKLVRYVFERNPNQSIKKDDQHSA